MMEMSTEGEALADVPDMALALADDLTLTGPVDVRRNYTFSPQVCVLSRPHGPQTESIGALRAQLHSQHIRDGRRSLSVCGATAGVGSTYVAVNLAVAMALAGTRTLLIDANLRTPGVQNFIAPPEPPQGLINYLIDEHEPLGVIVHSDVIPNLSIMYAGAGPGVPQELVSGRRFDDVITQGMRSHAFTVVDTPAAKDYSDFLGISVIARYALLVARKDHTRMADIRAMSQQLVADRVKLVGAFLNQY